MADDLVTYGLDWVDRSDGRARSGVDCARKAKNPAMTIVGSKTAMSALSGVGAIVRLGARYLIPKVMTIDAAKTFSTVSK